MHYLPQEIETWFVIPAIRSAISHCLIEKHKLRYEEVGEILGITRAAVCQYVKGKRADKVKFSKEINQKIKESSKILTTEKTNAVEEISKILNCIRTQSVPFSIYENHRELTLNDGQKISFKNGNYQVINGR